MTEGEATKESVLLAWKAKEYPEYTLTKRYYLAVSVIFLAIIGYAIYTKDWYGIGIVVVLSIIMVWYQRQTPKERIYRFSQLGLYVDNHFYPYNEMYSFWFLLKTPEKSLNIIFQKKYLPQLTIILNGTDPLKIRQTLGKYIPEESNRTENIADTMMRWFRL